MGKLPAQQQTHRPGAFKQTNKKHKHGQHASKGSINAAKKGKVATAGISKKKIRLLNKDQRRNKAVQLRVKTLNETVVQKSLVRGEGPFIVCVLPLNQHYDCSGVVTLLQNSTPHNACYKSPTGIMHIEVVPFKNNRKFSLVVPEIDNALGVLDVLKTADTVLLVASAMDAQNDEIIDDWGYNMLSTMFAQGLPTPVVAVTDLEKIPIKKRHENKQIIQKSIAKWLPDDKVIVLDELNAVNVLRKIKDQKRRSILFRDHRPHLLAEKLEYVPDNQGTLGTLKVTGYLRGSSLSASGLVHIPGLGDFQMTDIYGFKIVSQSSWLDSANFPILLDRCNSAYQESLDSENIPDPMDAEQTWPTAEELEMAENEQKLVKKIPKGWSDYQAAWIPDDDAEFQSDGSDNEEDNMFMDAMSEEHSEKSDEEEFQDSESVTVSEVAVNDEKYDQQMDIYAEKQALLKLKEAKSDAMFPDEVDTPMDQAARIRFQKFRGLESFRTSPWDPKENLPSDYARIFQFKNYDHTKKRILKNKKITHARPGMLMQVHIANVSQLSWSTFHKTKSPVVLIGMYPFEHKMSVLNTVLKRTQNCELPIKSKERLIFQCGYRRFVVNPVFSTHTNGQKHKFERFFQPQSTAVATFFAPIQFTPAPVLCYKEVDNELVLVATGSLISCDPNRLVIKRIVLSGHPFKIHKRSSVVRFMFFNREDIVYFKPCKLRTKMGRTGHIKEPLGTHGHMKCVFDGQLKSQDTVLLNLYKRIFPKWTYEDLVIRCDSNDDGMDV